MEERGAPANLLEEAVGPTEGRVVVVEDCVETSASFVLHYLLKRSLASNAVVFLSFAHSFSHYDRILRKLGCNLAAQRDSDKFFFFDMLMWECPGEKIRGCVGALRVENFLNSRNCLEVLNTHLILLDGDEEKTSGGGFAAAYMEIQKAISGLVRERKNSITMMIDDVSLMEVSAKGSTSLVLDFLHYCHTLTSELGCSLILLNHEDIYLSTERPMLLLQMEYLAEILIKAEPLATGLAKDVHGQLTVLNKGNDGLGSRHKMCNFHFKVKENNVEYFYPGSRT